MMVCRRACLWMAKELCFLAERDSDGVWTGKRALDDGSVFEGVVEKELRDELSRIPLERPKAWIRRESRRLGIFAWPASKERDEVLDKSDCADAVSEQQSWRDASGFFFTSVVPSGISLGVLQRGDSVDAAGCSLLHAACTRSMPRSVLALGFLTNRADLCEVLTCNLNQQGWTPLHCAVGENACPFTLRAILWVHKRADVPVPDHMDKSGRTPLKLCESINYTGYVTTFARFWKETTDQEDWLEAGRLQCVEILNKSDSFL